MDVEPCTGVERAVLRRFMRLRKDFVYPNLGVTGRWVPHGFLVEFHNMSYWTFFWCKTTERWYGNSDHREMPTYEQHLPSRHTIWLPPKQIATLAFHGYAAMVGVKING